ncbi:helix-turn-helix transcriptional regulator [Sphingobacterium sp. lm-10]|uniref:helix-turn-helix domain-containing protein n=1 Tax=Sphingobacterium sp. lm-10 TaxID=2944904 RepID=UPI002020B542|nr:helix-turn-helix domain-containing protein [Sphingobacterium sp. lm-10]MCL7986353.1 helix-turn-helix transcriptional regulator [Sphingobacterium sp. lm-10]
MKNVVLGYGVEMDWMEGLTQSLDGSLENGRINCPDHLMTGTLYGYQINDYLSTFFQDVTYHSDISYQMRNTTEDFVGIYFNQTEGDFIQIMDDVKKTIGRWAYNVAVVDATLPADYMVKSGSKSFSIYIFIKKTALLQSLSKIPKFEEIKDALFDAEQNTLVRFERASNQAWFLMNELRKTSFENPLFNTYLIGTVYGLMGDYLDQVIDHDIVLDKVSQEDIVGIVSSQSAIIDGIHGTFSGIETLAASVNMSESKYKQLFKKITGMSAHVFFLTNKLDAAKQMLETGNYSIAEVADSFAFFDASHFIEQFKNTYGFTPREYLTFL